MSQGVIRLSPADVNRIPLGTPPGAPAAWEYLGSDLPVGHYLVSAYAYEQAAAVFGSDLPTFESRQFPVQVLAGQQSSLSIFLGQELADPDLDLPFIHAVSLDGLPNFGRASTFTVHGAGGVGRLELSGSGAGTFGFAAPDPPALPWDGAGEGDAASPAGAILGWLPADNPGHNVPGDQLVVLRIVDSENNESSLVLQVPVDHQKGDLDFRLFFNHAPSIRVLNSIVNDSDEGVATMVADYRDPEHPTEDLLFHWDVSDCSAKGLEVDPTPINDEVSGTLLGDGASTHSVELRLDFSPPAPAPAPSLPLTCTVRVQVEDLGLLEGANWVPGSSSERIQNFHVTFGAGPIDIPPCYVGMDFCSGGCVDTQLDPSHCGACGQACGSGQHCSSGNCACDDSSLTACGNLCVDTQADDNFCGNCETSCDTNESCEAGACVLEGCPEGQDACGPGGACIDITSNPSHCGACNAACGQHEPCANSVCMPDPEWANWPVPPDSPSNYSTVGDTVRDNVTTLMWQRQPAPGTYTWQQAMDYCAGLDLAGYDDWHLPTRIQLISILNDLRTGPSINVNSFPGTPSAAFWTASRDAANSSQRWQINFNQGTAVVAGSGGSANVRCMRYDSSFPNRPANRFSNSGQIRKDNWTQIEWQREAGYTWDSRFTVLSNCSGIYGPFSRMPRRKELETIVDVRRTGNTAWESGFSGPLMSTPEYYWTSTNYGTSSNARVVDFRRGFSGNMSPNDWGSGRCVR